MSDGVAELAACQKGSVVAAAGCGKTELIARATAASTGRQLILTHTNAGVEALRRRLRRLGVGRDRASVDTIDGWCLKYLMAYPATSGGMPATPDGGTDWPATREWMSALLDHVTIRRVLDASYEGVFIDEYQDCDPGQHRLATKIATLLPVRVLGDPLQAVFGWTGPMPSWERDVEAAFPNVGTLTTPWRCHTPPSIASARAAASTMIAGQSTAKNSKNTLLKTDNRL